MGNENATLIEGKPKIWNIVNVLSKQPLKYFLITLIVLLTLIKLNLIGKGFISFPDEFRYYNSGSAAKDLSGLRVESAVNKLFSTQGRPANAIINLIPISIQNITAKVFNLNNYESNNCQNTAIVKYGISQASNRDQRKANVPSFASGFLVVARSFPD